MNHHEPAVYRLPRGSETILVGVDNEALRCRVRIALEACGYDVLAARSGAEALRLAEQYRPSISLLVCQGALPAMDGREQAKRLAALAAESGESGQHQRLGVLLLADDCEAAAQAGDLVACLQQPIRPSTLVVRVRQILDTGPGADRPGHLELRAEPSNGSCLGG
jgi:CheY-like chemotaxis protein